jgi:hypothetical protein
MASATATLGQSGVGDQDHARRSRRDTLVTAGQIWPVGRPEEGQGVVVSVMNVSLEGIAFRSRSSFIEGQEHYLKLTAGPLKLEGRVRIAWCHQRADGNYDTGAQFVGG